jgi:ABC-2 type transport system ATP-binding protein
MHAADPVIRLAGVSKRFGEHTALTDIDVEVRPGEVFGYLGPNGAGKTTTLRIVVGLLRPTAGRCTVLGLDSWRQRCTIARSMAFLSADNMLYAGLTGRDHLELVQRLRGRGTEDGRSIAKQLDLDLDRPVGTLSRGTRQKLALMLALCNRPALLVLDEPTTGLDPIVQHEFHAIVRDAVANGTTVLLSSHVLDEVQRLADRVGIIRAGRIIAVERLADLRAHALHHVSLHFAGQPHPAEFLAVPDLRNLVVDGSTLRFTVPQTALDRIVKLAARHELLDLSCQEADLAETFLDWYQPAVDHVA